MLLMSLPEIQVIGNDLHGIQGPVQGGLVVAGGHAEAGALPGHGDGREAHAHGGDLEADHQLLHEGADLGRHDQQHGDHGAVVVAVDDQAHLLETLSVLAEKK